MTIIIPLYTAEQDLETTLKGVLDQSLKDIEILILNQCIFDPLSSATEKLLASDPRIVRVDARYKNIASMKYDGFKRAHSDYVMELPPNIVLNPNLCEKYFQAMKAKPETAMVYADYRELYPDGHVEEKILRDYDGDVTERAHFGFVYAIRRESYKAVGGYDVSYNSAQDYDLRLKLSEHYDLVRLPEILYGVRISPEEAEEKTNVGASKLFFPGEGKYGGFSYLFYEKDEEAEIEKAFKDFLRRQGAYLTHDPVEVPYRGDEAFSPMVSVIIPAYNRVRFIGKALDSILKGTLQDFEIIVVDNGSRDGTIELVEEYCRRDDRIRLIKNDKNIIAFSLNLGVKAARGKYISQLDSDDEYTPKTLGMMVDHLEKNPKCAIAISYYELMDEDGKTMPEFGVIEHLEFDRNNHLRVDGAGAVRTWHRKVIEEFGLFNEEDFGHYAEDYDLVTQVAEKYDVDRVPAVLYRYRRHPDNTDSRRDPEMKIRNKTLIRQRAIARRIRLNKKLHRPQHSKR